MDILISAVAEHSNLLGHMLHDLDLRVFKKTKIPVHGRLSPNRIFSEDTKYLKRIIAQVKYYVSSQQEIVIHKRKNLLLNQGNIGV